jgi:hypothetical protein
MKYQNPLKLILVRTMPHWGRAETRLSVHEVLDKAMQCRTAELGGEVFRSENQELVLYHSCKSRACPSCGYRANVQWLRERWAALPDARVDEPLLTCRIGNGRSYAAAGVRMASM